MTTFDPGASDVFTHGLRLRPRSFALRATRPAPIITSGLDVFVQDVIAAITTSPSPRSKVCPSLITVAVTPGIDPSGRRPPSRSRCHWTFIASSSMRSCGRVGPASDGTMVPRSSSRLELYSMVRLSSRHMPCSL